jgi:hypothetical protein
MNSEIWGLFAQTISLVDLGSPRTHEPLIVAADEYSIEPRLTFKVALAFIEQVHAAMAASAAAWKQRYEWERIRQGYFSSADEAFLNDYVQVRVTVLEARDISLPDPEQEVRICRVAVYP